MKTMLIAMLVPVILLGFSGCQTSAHRPDAAVPLAGTEWVLTELNGKPFVASEGLLAPTLKLDAATKRANGTSGINRYAGPCELDGSAIKFGVLMGTRMAGPPEAMAIEDAFLAALREVSAWKITGQMLELSDGVNTVARFKAGPPSDDAPEM